MQTEAKLLQAEKKARTQLRAEATLLLLAPRRHGQGDLAEAIVVARINSARAGVAAADAALKRIGLEQARLSSIAIEGADVARAESAASSYVRWLRENYGELAELSDREAAALVRGRIDRIAATESSQAFNTGLREEARRVARDRQVAVYRTWSALGDSCPRCSDNEGDTVRVDQPYKSGEEPGSVHPSCRCTEGYSL